MQDKFVYVKELKSGLTRTNKVYPIIIDQDNEQWNIWNQDVNNILINSCYLFSFIINDRGFKDIEKITPLVNIFQQKALKEVASRNDIIRNLTVCLSYSKDMVVGGVLELDKIYDMTNQMYQFITDKVDSLMPQDEVKFGSDFKEPKGQPDDSK